MMEYGEKVSQEEVDRIFADERAKLEQIETIKGEIASLGVGECIAYPRVIKSKNLYEGFLTDYALSSLLPRKGKFKVIGRKDKMYIYREH